MTEKIVFANGTEFTCPEQAQNPVAAWPKGRDWKKITVIGTVEAVKEAFIDNASYQRQWDSERTEFVFDEITGEQLFDENELPLTVTSVRTEIDDLSDYSIAGDIVDQRNGNISVYMGRLTEVELLESTIDQLVLEALGGDA